LSGGTGLSVYHHIGQTDGYVISLGDSGTVADIFPNGLAVPFARQNNFAIVRRSNEVAQIFQGFSSLPSVDQVINVIN
jgi:hypothetical protein